MNRQQIAHIPPPPDPLRPPETDLERVTWTYVPPPDRPSASDILFVIAIGVIVGIALAGVLIRA